MKITQFAAIGAFMTAVAGPAAAENVVWKYSSWLPPQHHVNTEVMYPWFEQIEKVTEGRVKVETLPKMVGSAAGQFDVVRDGLADVSFIVTGYTPGRFVMSELGEMSWVGNDPSVFGPIFWDIYKEYIAPHDEYRGVKVMTMISNAPGNIVTTQKEITSMEDLKGIKLRSTGPYATSLLEAVGAVPILKSSNEAFEMMSTGVIDGSLSQPETVINMNMLDMTKYYTLVPGGLFSATLGVVMNEDSWSRISPEDQEAIWKVSDRVLAQLLADDFATAGNKAMEQMKATDTLTIQTISDDFVAELKEATRPLEEEWATRAKEKGMEDPLEILAEFRRRVAEAESKATN
ncbi:TRAP transporter substrate-binding protein [Seohaeicola zhoushanensis]|uniref:ABC transporter substrate-binding protein n=1 Tax=Seohaeicola zhoushanensis TaxID=1569283 RepID=A0A8J3H0S3_9RHOB|nr:TRAP transporter substrate-binding protein [Seohaeicola zhoushanensis]GHF62173.1 ABC transporter substrate-binding protein [Seohaeicola zhoushanensis]